ncbi:hypothetical protein [Sphingomonas montanisoli]|uniref:Uncharacterized protein n=1 Tax=Sphingomonas montanisoli TaxID=2606412 RepID=A0A5D9CCA5_9SPHN|nr:hypothetical protein [Sphingomonas montanisoli]TZG29598.1 hypothetical protein FYJ91_05635 [Sphingomonas montanisoli]
MLLRFSQWAAAIAAAFLVEPALAQSVSSYCGPDVPQSAYGNPTFWGSQLTYRVGEADGMRILMAEGAVKTNDAATFADALARAGAIDEIWLSSPGGNMYEGMKIGRLLHRSGIAVRVPAGRACISSCSLALLGGVLRSVDQGAYYGIHMFTAYGDLKGGVSVSGAQLKGIEQDSAQAAADLARYLIEMSASLDFLTGMSGQKNDGVCFVTPSGLRKYNVSNIE